MEFDCLWVSGLTEENWPLKARPHPFLPVALQRKAGIPEAAAETSLALDRRITEGWLAAADEVVFSWPEKDGDRDLLPSPLIADVAPGSVEVAAVSTYQEVLFQARSTESFPDGKAPPLREQKVRGGTRVLADQAACPFRAFARHRLQRRGAGCARAGPGCDGARQSAAHADGGDLEGSEDPGGVGSGSFRDYFQGSRKSRSGTRPGGPLRRAGTGAAGTTRARLARGREGPAGVRRRRDRAKAKPRDRRPRVLRPHRPHGPPRRRHARAHRLQDRQPRHAERLAGRAARRAAAAAVRGHRRRSTSRRWSSRSSGAAT